MKLSTVLALIVCVAFPIISYIFVKDYTNNNVKMPLHYFFDKVNEDTINGKKHNDTIWHRVKNLKLINQFGDTVQLNDLSGKILLVNFFFTHCPTICPKVTANLLKVQDAINKDSSLMMISISLDPKRDTTQTLRKYAKQFGIKNDNWWLCRLINDTLENVMLKEFKAGYSRDSIIEITHTPDVFLLDKNRIIRGKNAPYEITEENPDASRFYSGLNKNDLQQLLNDAEMVKMEKNRKNKTSICNSYCINVNFGSGIYMDFIYAKEK